MHPLCLNEREARAVAQGPLTRQMVWSRGTIIKKVPVTVPLGVVACMTVVLGQVCVLYDREE